MRARAAATIFITRYAATRALRARCHTMRDFYANETLFIFIMLRCCAPARARWRARAMPYARIMPCHYCHCHYHATITTPRHAAITPRRHATRHARACHAAAAAATIFFLSPLLMPRASALPLTRCAAMLRAASAILPYDMRARKRCC